MTFEVRKRVAKSKAVADTFEARILGVETELVDARVEASILEGRVINVIDSVPPTVGIENSAGQML